MSLNESKEFFIILSLNFPWKITKESLFNLEAMCIYKSSLVREGELNSSAHKFLRESLTSALSRIKEILLFLRLVLRFVF